jgi:hypothetical protein
MQTIIKTKYVVYICNYGYYADEQSNLKWSFTKNIDRAMKYNTFKKANKVFNQIKINSYKLKIDYDNSYIGKIELETILIIRSKMKLKYEEINNDRN